MLSFNSPTLTITLLDLDSSSQGGWSVAPNLVLLSVWNYFNLNEHSDETNIVCAILYRHKIMLGSLRHSHYWKKFSSTSITFESYAWVDSTTAMKIL